MSVAIDVKYEGGLTCRAVHEPSGAILETTAPTDNGGDGSLFSPTDLFATAFATCVMTIMALAAQKHDIELGGMQARVTKGMSEEGPRRIGRLQLRLRLPIEPSERERRAIEAAGRGCPVFRSIGEHIDATVTFEWGCAPDA